MRFSKFFSININHDYFQSSVCPDLLVQPTMECARLLKNYKLCLKDDGYGNVAVFAAVDDFDKPVVEVASSTFFDFYILLKNTAFGSYSNLPSKQPQEVYFFSSEHPDPKEQSLLITSTVNSGQRPIDGKTVFGTIQIVFKGSLAVNYTIHFKAAEVNWKYYFLANGNANNLSINAADAGIAFSKRSATDNQKDNISKAIDSAYPNVNLVVFESEAPVPLSERGKGDIQLVNMDKNEVVISHLPNPCYNENGIKIINLLNQ